MGVLEFILSLVGIIVSSITIIICMGFATDNVKLERQNVKLKQQLCKEEYTKNNIKMEDKNNG